MGIQKLEASNLGRGSGPQQPEMVEEMLQEIRKIGTQTSKCDSAVASLVEDIVELSETQETNHMLVLDVIRKVNAGMVKEENFEKKVRSIVVAEKLDMQPLQQDFLKITTFCDGIHAWLQHMRSSMETWGLEHVHNDMVGITAWLECVHKILKEASGSSQGIKA